MNKSVEQTMNQWEQMMEEDKARRRHEKQVENRIIATFFSVELFICMCIILWTKLR